MVYLKRLLLKINISSVVTFLNLLRSRVRDNHIHVESGYLAYVTIMSLVPLMMVMFSMMTAFPLFNELSLTVEAFIYNNFVPAAGDVLQNHLKGFVGNASKMSAVAISFLFLFALLLISSIDKTINKLWRVTKKRSLITSFSMYWMVLTLGPILIGSSIAASSYIFSVMSVEEYGLVGVSNLFIRCLPWLTSIASFFLLYTVVPIQQVSLKCAVGGAVFAAVLFEIAKKSFAFYIIQLPSYKAIYGALSAVPILFLWVYLSWLVVLMGALFTLALEDYKNKNEV